MLLPGAHFEAGVNEQRRLAVRRGLTATNCQQSAELQKLYASERERSRPVEVYLVAENGSVLGGAYGVTDWRWFNLDVVWLAEPVRGTGAGRLLMEKIEAAARDAGATAIRLDTLDFQARGFYEKCGYRVYGELANYPEMHTQYLMAKELGSADLE